MAVTFINVATSVGRPVSALNEQQVAQINWWIKVAETKIRNHFVKIGTPFHELDQDMVDVVVVEAVARKVANPLGKQNERIDDYSYGLNPEEASSQIRITDEEWAMLTPARAAGAFTIRTDLGAHRHPIGW